MGLTEDLPLRPAIDNYVRIVRDDYLLRQMMFICSDGIERAAGRRERVDTLVGDIDRRMVQIVQSFTEEQSLLSQTRASFDDLQDQREETIEPGVSTGLNSLDQIIGGFKARKLYIVGGRPSMGKTSIMIQAAIQHCVRGIRTRLISLEMTSSELLQRISAAISGVPYGHLAEPKLLSNEAWERLRRAHDMIKQWTLEIDDRGDQTLDSALSACRVSVRMGGTRFIAVDYLQCLRFVAHGTLRHHEISDAAKRIREFAKAENVPVLLLSSITESQEKDPNKPPSMADLRGSGDLAFHADVAALIHRRRGCDGASIDLRTDIIVAKQRGGPTGVARVQYNTDTLLFEERPHS